MNHTEKTGEACKTGWLGAWNCFWFYAVDPIGLHALRVMAGLLILAWILPFAGYQGAFYSLGGWVDRQMFEAIAEQPDFEPQRSSISWSIFYLAGEDPTLVSAVYWVSVLVVVLFTLGIAPRITSILAWVAAASFLGNPVLSYDADFLVLLPTFYVTIGYLFYGQFSRNLNPAERVLGPLDESLLPLGRRNPAPPPSYAANFAVRMFQVHFAIIVVVSVLHKLQMAPWWSGVSFFYWLYPPFQTQPDAIAALQPSAPSILFLLSVTQYATLAWQLAFPVFAWRRGLWRVLLIGGAALGWIANAFFFHFPLFGPVYFIACLNYLTPDEWRRIRDYLLTVLPGGSVLAEPARRPSPAARPKTSKV